MVQKNFWTKIGGACCIIVACISALVKLVLKYVAGTNSNLENPPDAQQKIYKTVADIPGPRSLPVFGTKWIYWKFCLYKLNAVHLAYEAAMLSIITAFLTQSSNCDACSNRHEHAAYKTVILVDQRRIHDFGHSIKMRTIHIVFFRMFIRLTFLQVVLACIRRLRSQRILCTPWFVLICRAIAHKKLHVMLRTYWSRVGRVAVLFTSPPNNVFLLPINNIHACLRWTTCQSQLLNCLLNNDCHLHGRTTQNLQGPFCCKFAICFKPLTTLLLSRTAWEIRLLKSRFASYLISDMFNRYGDIICEEALWNIPVISVKNRDFIERVLRQSGKYPIRPPNEVTANYRKSRPDRYTNTGLVNEQGEVWAMLRNKLTPELTSPRTMRRFLPEVNQLADDFNNLISLARDGNNVVRGFEAYCNRMGLESTCTLILGRRIGFLDGEVSDTATRLADAVTSQFRASQEAFYGLPLWKLIPTKAYKDFVASEDALYDIVSEFVESALIDEQQSFTDVRSVFMSILQASELDNRDKKAAIIDYIAAGIKTLGNTLVFLLYLVAKHPEVQEKIYNEVSLLAPAGTPITSEHLHKATYLNACITEAHRLKPTAPCIARVLESEIEYDNYRLPPGTVVLLHTGLACLDENNFKDATSYRPERWLDELTKKSPFLVAPFGCGKRMCPGKRFIDLELQIVLAKMVKQFQIDFEGQLKTEFEFLLTPVDSNFILQDRIY